MMNDNERMLTIENQQLRDTVTLLCKKLGEKSKHTRRVNQAFNDAMLMVSLHSSGDHPSRRYMAERHSFTQNRWQNAIALLRLARLIIGDRYWSNVDPARAGVALEDARSRAINAPTAYRSRLNKHGRM